MAMDKVKHVVLLMLENQSFDSMLGWLYENGATPSVNIPAPQGNGPTTFAGLYGIDGAQFENDGPGGLTAVPSRGAEGYTVPTPDPGEEFAHVNMQLFATATPAPGATPTMKGYLADYVGVMQSFDYDSATITARALSILQSYTTAQLPVLNQLAQHYAVCDAWFSSVPSQTNPNRAFALTGTSYGLVDNGELETNPEAKLLEAAVGMNIGDDRFPQTTIFNALETLKKDWMVYWQTSYLPQKISTLLGVLNSPAVKFFPVLGPLIADLAALSAPVSAYLEQLSSGTLSSSYTWRLFEAIQSVHDPASHFASLDTFHSKARAGQLPAFSYIEPFWTISQSGTDTGPAKNLLTAMGNDYHPPSNKLVGEAFVKDVYESLIANQGAWESTVLVITFDEPVGSFDHVAPPGAVPPWGDGGTPPFKSETGFAFDRLGGRVPTILVSPLVQQGTVFRSTTSVAYDHSSIVATVLEWAGATTTEVAAFGQRTAAAPTFDGVVTLTTPRTDARSLPFLQQGGQANGAALNYGDWFVLRHQSGQYLAGFSQQHKVSVVPGVLPKSMMIDLGVDAYFPTLSSKASAAVPLMFLSPSPDPGPVTDGDMVWLVSTEAGLVADNFLGAWSDSHDCYWFDQYLDGAHATNQQWMVHNVAGPAPVLFGQSVRLVNDFFDQGLARDSRLGQGTWITTSANGDTWQIVPCPKQQ